MADGSARILLVVALGLVAAFALVVVALGDGGDDAPGVTVGLTSPADSAAGAPTGDPASGEIRFVRSATTEFDPFLLEGTLEDRAFIRDHYWRLRGFPPFSDEAIEWGPPAHFYDDLYALYPSEAKTQQLIEQHPDWILRNGEGAPLYIPFDCAEGTCPAYAGDPGNPQFRAHWIEQAARQLAKGYVGIFVDNVNLEMRVSDGFGVAVAPLDPRTGKAMTLDAWQGYVADFVEQIRAAFPAAELVHNTIWFTPRTSAVRRAVEAADYVEVERGFSDFNLAGGDGSGYMSLIDHVDWVHSLGRSVMLEPYDLDASRRLFELASYFLVNDGVDSLASDFEANPDNWWPGWEADLGAPLGPRTQSGGVLRRDFERGMVLVNPPGTPPRTVALPGPHVDLEGTPVEAVDLGPAQGAVLLAR